jgi:nucleotide-binding universal stress UspA family protein
MADVLACIDNSAYSNGVCDHAGWFASDPDVGVEVLHVLEPTTDDIVLGAEAQADLLIERAVWRLREEGVGPVTSAQLSGGFVETACQLEADMIVMGKRGQGSDAQRRSLGSSVDAMVRATGVPVCLASKLFLPIHRVLVLVDARVDHRTAVEFVASHPRLVGLPTDVVVVAGVQDEPDAKLEWVRKVLGDEGVEVFSLRADGLDDAVTQYMESRGAELIVVSRDVIVPDPGPRLRLIEERGLWGMRTPVLIC